MIDLAHSPNSKPRRKARGGGLLFLGWLLSVILVVEFVLKVSKGYQWITACGILLAGGILVHRNRVYAVGLIPITALIGVTTPIDLGGFSVHLGDIYLVMVFMLFMLLPTGEKERQLRFPRIKTMNFSVAAILVLVGLSWALSLDQAVSFLCLIGIAQLFMVYFVTRWVLRDSNAIPHVLLSWVVAAMVGSATIIFAYTRGEALLVDMDDDFKNLFSTLIVSDSVLFRASFFVTGFIFPLAQGLILAIVFLVFSTNKSWRMFSLLVASIVVNLVASALLGNLTLIAGALLGSMLVLTLSMAFKGRGRKVAISLAVVLVSIAVGHFLLSRIMDAAQLDLLYQRFESSESLSERMLVWGNVATFTASDPKVLCVGLGPDISIRMAGHPVVKGIMVGNDQQGAVDSGYLYVILNYGLFAFLLIGRVLIRQLAKLRSLMRGYGSILAGTLGISIVVWLFMCITQQHGVSKPVFCLAQVLAISCYLTDFIGIAQENTVVAQSKWLTQLDAEITQW